MEYVIYDEFKKMDMRIGTIRAVEPVEGTDKLLKCQIDFGLKLVKKETSSPDSVEQNLGLKPISREKEIGSPDQPEVQAGLGDTEPDIRQIVSGIREYFPEFEKLVGKQVLYIVNLEPRTIRGVESQGMLMAVDGKDGKPVFLTPEVEVNPGSRVR